MSVQKVFKPFLNGVRRPIPDGTEGFKDLPPGGVVFELFNNFSTLGFLNMNTLERRIS